MKMLHITRYGIVTAVTILLAATAGADVINVSQGGPLADFRSIQAAIADPQTVDGDEIVVQAGIYNETIDFLGKAITLRSASGNPQTTAINGAGHSHVVQCVSGEGADTVLKGFWIMGGNANGDTPDDRGGKMYIDASSPTVTDSTFTGNTATRNGGGIYNDESNTTVINCILWGDSPNEILNHYSKPKISFSNLQCGLPSGTTDNGGNIDIDPQFIDGPGGNLRLQSSSQSIYCGDPRAVPDGVTTDLDAKTRIRYGAVDMGAYEFLGTND